MRAADRFFERLEGVTDPEDKRKAIGELFIRIFEEAARIEDATPSSQGTLYPDVIESGGGTAARSRPSRATTTWAGLPEDMTFELVEPLRALFKDEVRKVGEGWACPRRSVAPAVPGPGLGVRIIGEVTPTRWRRSSRPTSSSARSSGPARA